MITVGNYIGVGKGIGGAAILYTISYGSTLFFDEDRVYGYEFNLSGNLQIDLTGADTDNTVLVYYKSDIAPVLSIIGGGTVNSPTGDFVENVTNIITVTYNGSSVNYSFNAQI